MIAQRYSLITNIHTLIGTMITLLIIGLIFIYSSSSVFALERHGSAYFFLQKQLVGITLGLLGFFIFRSLPLTFIKKCTTLFFWSSLALTIGTLIPGIARTIHGSSRWLSCGGFAFQPSDLLKLSLVMFVARFITKKENAFFDFKTTLAPLLVVLAIVALVLLRQPDFGLTVTLITTSFLMIFVAGLPLMYLGIIIGATLPIVGLLILKYPYRLKRILVFLDPWKDPQGSGFQIIQSLIAIGSGRWLGMGIGQSKQKFFYLPMQHTDFIFSIIAEETGFIGSSIVILLYTLFLYLGCKIALQLEDTFSRYTVIGLTLIITLQAFINIFVTTGLLPTKGIGLPFISYGNSALICSMCMVGLISNCGYQAYKNPSIHSTSLPLR